MAAGIFRRVRQIASWGIDTTRDVFRAAWHAWKIQGDLSLHSRWENLQDAEGDCRRVTVGRYEMLVRSYASTGVWFFQVQDVFSHTPLFVSDDEWENENEARMAAVNWVLRGGVGGVKPVAAPPRFGSVGGGLT